MDKRRQNHSCEQCRKSKKACDGFLVNNSQYSLARPAYATSGHAISEQDSATILSCSYCVRTDKMCTLNPHWANIELKNAQMRSAHTPDQDSPENREHNIKRQNVQYSRNVDFGLSPLMPLESEADALVQLLQSQPLSHNGWDLSFVMQGGPPTTSTRDFMRSSNLNGIGPDDQRNSPLESWDLSLSPNEPLSTTNLDCLSIPIDDYSSSFGTQSTDFDISQDVATLPQPASSKPSPRQKKRKQNGQSPERRRSLDWQDSYNMSLSPFSAAHLAMADSNRTAISQSLLRIYHDVVENNLACWLSEEMCPYQMEKRKQVYMPLQRFTPKVRIQPEWGSDWSNQMYRRVRQLDRVAQAVNLVQFTHSENRAASKALDLVVVAFATQWAQGKRRKKRFDQDAWDSEELEGAFSEFGDDFEQHLRCSMWEQAKRALQEVADLENFRVIYAELVFGLIQKPWAADDYKVGLPNDSPDCRPAILAQVTNILAQGGQPILMERAARKIQAIKYRFEAMEAGFRDKDRFGKHGSDGDDRFHKVTTEDRRTIGLLYWMTVMFDTVSSCMNERPVVIVDEECEHDAAHGVSREQSTTTILSRKWELNLYAQDDSENPSSLHWPCPYEEATRAVARSAAVKVLLFRYVSYIQNALRKGQRDQVLEEVIRVTTTVYRYWNKTYGAFFRDLVKSFDTVPKRIKSWFPCIGIPWHLGSLMLADLIDFIDENHLSLEKARTQRFDTSMALRIRRSSAIDLADLAKVVVPQHTRPCAVQRSSYEAFTLP